MEIQGGHGVRRRVGGGAVCRQLAPWEVGREKLISILFEAKKEGKRRKIPVLATVESTAVVFCSNPLIEKWERPSASCTFWQCKTVDVVPKPPGLSPVAVSPLE